MLTKILLIVLCANTSLLRSIDERWHLSVEITMNSPSFPIHPLMTANPPSGFCINWPSPDTQIHIFNSIQCILVSKVLLVGGVIALIGIVATGVMYYYHS